jgi:hypothetical protein
MTVMRNKGKNFTIKTYTTCGPSVRLGTAKTTARVATKSKHAMKKFEIFILQCLEGY